MASYRANDKLALTLAQVGVHVEGLPTLFVEGAGEAIGHALGVGEREGAATVARGAAISAQRNTSERPRQNAHG